MRAVTVVLCLAVLVDARATAQQARRQPSISDACVAYNQRVMDQLNHGQLKPAEITLSGALAGEEPGLDGTCDWIILHNMASVMGASGRLAEAEIFAARSIAILEKLCDPEDPLLLRPLQVLGATQFALGKLAKAREALRRMELIRTERPSQRAPILALSAVVLEAEGRIAEAERAYIGAVEAVRSENGGHTAQEASALYVLGNFYLKFDRLDEAGRAFGQASRALAASPNAVPSDRFNLLNSLAVLHCRQGDSRRAEEELRTALSILDGEPQPDPVRLEPLLSNYAFVLRKNHRSHQARSIEARVAALPRGLTGGVVDASELVTRSKAGR
jgi:tetratricopeptide (TPR) repeat protein